MKWVVLLSMFLVVSCGTTKRIKPKKKVIPVTWTEKKRTCHILYMERFGLGADDVIKICKEELQRGE